MSAAVAAPPRAGIQRARYWIVDQLLSGKPAGWIEDRLCLAGVPRDEAAREVAAALASDAVQAAKIHMRRRKQLEQLLEMYAALWRRSAASRAIPEVATLDEETFAEAFYYRNRPVVVRGGVAHWPAVGRWTPRYFKQHFGSVEIEYMRGTNRYAHETARARATMGAFVDEVESTRASNAFYVVATNRSLRNPGLAPLSDDLRPIAFAPALDFDDPQMMRLWFGPRGTITALHHDVMNVLFAQVYGRKQFILAPSFCLPMAANRVGLRSEIDPVAIDAARSPRAAEIPWLHVEVGPGDLLFIPLGWWHWVFAAETSISIGFGDFTVGGAYDEWSAADLDAPLPPFPFGEERA